MSNRIQPKNLMILSLVVGIVCVLAVELGNAAELKTKSGSTPVTSNQLNAVVTEHFSQQQDFKPTDLIDQGDVREILAELARLGWKVSDADAILKQTLPTDHIMVETFESRKGTQFMRKVADYQLIYDRMHRTAEMPGGKALVRDIVKLPNGEIYAKMKPVPGNPTFTELLPKQRNGKTPSARDFDKPTGYIYTVAQLRSRLEYSRQYDAQADR